MWFIEIKVEWLSNEHNQILETFWDDDTDVSVCLLTQGKLVDE